ncbi:Lrp/AsnC family transcriptional regulator [Vineibacter terrae]
MTSAPRCICLGARESADIHRWKGKARAISRGPRRSFRERTTYLKAKSMKRLRYKDCNLDAIDARILEALVGDARITIADLARLVGLSSPSVSDRIRRLEEAGAIEGYTLSINPRVLGLPITAWLRIKPIPGQLQKVAEILRGLPEIVECDRVMGEDCFIARAYVQSVDELERLVDHVIPYAMTNTSIVQSSPVKRRLPPILGTPVLRERPI